MKKTLQSLWMFGALVAFLSVGMALSAQDSTPQTTTPPSAQQPAQTPDSDTQTSTPPSQSQSQPDSQAQQPPAQQNSQMPDSSSQRPDSQAQSSASGTQSFTGTIVKSGDKYVFQDAASGNTYDIDHQEEVQKFEGKRVKVHGTLDSTGKTIHLQ